MSRSGKQGFTLIELLISLALVGILASIAINEMASYRLKSNNSSAVNDLMSFKTYLEAYFAEYHHYP